MGSREEDSATNTIALERSTRTSCRRLYWVAPVLLLLGGVAVWLLSADERDREFELAQACGRVQDQSRSAILAFLPSKGSDEVVSSAVRQAVDEIGRDYFVCPKTGSPYRLNPYDRTWREGSSGAIVVYCTCPHHFKEGMIALDARGDQLWLQFRVTPDWDNDALTAEHE